MTDCRSLFSLFFLALLASADVDAASKHSDRDITQVTLLQAQSSTPAAANSKSSNQLFEAAGRAVTSHAAELGVAMGQALQPASLQTSPLGSSVVTYKQTVGNYEVLGARISTVLDAGGNVRALSGGFSPNVASAGATAFKLSAPAALQSLLKNSGIVSNASTPKALERRNGYQYFSIDSGTVRALRPARLKPVYFPADGRLIAAYYIELVGWRRDRAHAEGWGTVVSAEDGRILQRTKLTHDAAHSYRVFTDLSGVPLEDAYGRTVPHPTATPDGFLPTVPAPMQLITLGHAPMISTGDPWLPPGATETLGNNVDAFFNSLVAVDGVWDFLGDGPVLNPDEGDFRAPLTGAATFDYPYDATATASDYVQTPGEPATPIPTTSAQLNAKIVQAFYAVNWLHDYFYDLGYDEASGNSQQDNYGRGGLAGDPVVVNAAFPGIFTFAPADGESPQMLVGPNAFSDAYIFAAGDVGAGTLTYMNAQVFYRDFETFGTLISVQHFADIACGLAGETTHTGNLAAFQGAVKFLGTGQALGPMLQDTAALFTAASSVEVVLNPHDGGEADNYLVEDALRKQLTDNQLIPWIKAQFEN